MKVLRWAVVGMMVLMGAQSDAMRLPNARGDAGGGRVNRELFGKARVVLEAVRLAKEAIQRAERECAAFEELSAARGTDVWGWQRRFLGGIDGDVRYLWQATRVQNEGARYRILRDLDLNLLRAAVNLLRVTVPAARVRADTERMASSLQSSEARLRMAGSVGACQGACQRVEDIIVLLARHIDALREEISREMGRIEVPAREEEYSEVIWSPTRA